MLLWFVVSRCVLRVVCYVLSMSGVLMLMLVVGCCCLFGLQLVIGIGTCCLFLVGCCLVGLWVVFEWLLCVVVISLMVLACCLWLFVVCYSFLFVCLSCVVCC